MSGTLFVVATPIGNLEDTTFRAVRVLGEVNVIAAEDTRRTSKLLAHYEIRRPLLSLREHNEARETPRLLERLARGESVALVTDAGTPGIADPGARLVAAVRGAGFPVVPIPGASAIAAALSVSGASADSFVFLGFPPSSGPARDEWMTTVKHDPRLLVFFESPHRIARTLSDLDGLLGSRPILVCREITKMNEQFVVCPITSGHEPPAERGEFTLIVYPEVIYRQDKPDYSAALDLIGRMTEYAGMDVEAVLDMVSAYTKLPKRQLQTAFKKHRIALKRGQQQEAE